MNLKQYTVVRVVIAIALAAFVASSFLRQDFFWPVVAIASAILLLLILRRRVREVLADERDYSLGGKAARYSIQIFSIGSVVCMFVFFSLEERDPVFKTIAFVLAYSTCALMLLYSLIFSILHRRSFHA